MIDKSISSCAIFSEFSSSDAVFYFDRIKQKTLIHIDSLYYSITLEGDAEDPDRASLHDFVEELTSLKLKKINEPASLVQWHDLDVVLGGFTQFYSICRSLI